MGLVICNYDDNKPITVFIKADEGTAPNSYRLVDDPDWKDTEDGIIILPRSAVVVIER